MNHSLMIVNSIKLAIVNKRMSNLRTKLCKRGKNICSSLLDQRS